MLQPVDAQLLARLSAREIKTATATLSESNRYLCHQGTLQQIAQIQERINLTGLPCWIMVLEPTAWIRLRDEAEGYFDPLPDGPAGNVGTMLGMQVFLGDVPVGCAAQLFPHTPELEAALARVSTVH